MNIAREEGDCTSFPPGPASRSVQLVQSPSSLMIYSTGGGLFGMSIKLMSTNK